jgi:hypothetical protein
VRDRGQDRDGEARAEAGTRGGVADLLLVEIPLHVLARDVQPDRRGV